ncbi:MAG: phosphate/phosphite/phosphonate ABC transporter substrate-binding protein [Vicinamibacteria bacterium]|nr:phosphate/phosphite/phosphonate ABC transporter substrate-binding protein [Vicinamibacteria bacterium]
MSSPGARYARIAGAVWLLFAAGSAPALPAVTPPNPKEVRFGVIAEEANEPDRMLRVYSGLLAEMRQRLAPKGMSLGPLVITRDLSELARRLKQGEVDMVIESVFPTLELQERSGQKLAPEFAIVRRNQREYHSVFFTRRDSPLKTLEDLKGHTLVLQAERSTSAFAVPRAELARHGIGLVPEGQSAEGRKVAFYILAGAELNQAIWVLNGKGDAGAFNDSDWARLPKKVRDDLVSIHETRPLLRGALSFRVGLDPELKRACEDVLLSLHRDPAGQASLESAAGITRFERLTAKDLAEIGAWRLALKGVTGPR